MEFFSIWIFKDYCRTAFRKFEMILTTIITLGMNVTVGIIKLQASFYLLHMNLFFFLLPDIMP